MKRLTLALCGLLVAATAADAHYPVASAVVVRSRLVVPYVPTVAVQAVYAAPLAVVQPECYVAPQAVVVPQAVYQPYVVQQAVVSHYSVPAVSQVVFQRFAVRQPFAVHGAASLNVVVDGGRRGLFNRPTVVRSRTVIR